jgi:hypothetical protein
VAEGCAKFLNRPVALVYPAVLALCGEEDETLTDDLPPPDPETFNSLHSALIKVTVAYTVKISEGAQRVVQAILYDATDRKFTEQKSTTELRWEDITEDVREAALRTGQRTVSFTLYSAADHA